MEERLHRTTLSKFRIGISAGLCSFQGDLVKVMRMGIHSLKAAALKDRLKLDMLPDTGLVERTWMPRVGTRWCF